MDVTTCQDSELTISVVGMDVDESSRATFLFFERSSRATAIS
jgi:hypothetical protein